MGRIPGAVLSIFMNNKSLYENSFGYSQVYPNIREMTIDTLFDLASLTKVVATLPSIMLLHELKVIDMNQPVQHYLHGFRGQGREHITIRNLLTHTSGLPSSQELTDQFENELFSTELQYKTGSRVVYSDLGFILLGMVVEEVTWESLDVFCEEKIFRPLKMFNTVFKPFKPAYKIAATEYRTHLDAYQCGDVHDENSSRMGGVSGHAGLFSTVEDLQIYNTMMLNGGTVNSLELLKYETVQEMLRLQTPDGLPMRGLGWVIYKPNDESFAKSFTQDGFGHTGFTGTSLYINPAFKLSVVFLTNRVHFGRNIDIQDIRLTVHDLLFQYLRGKGL